MGTELKPRRDRKAIKEKKQKFIEDCEQSLIRILDISAKDGSVLTYPELEAILNERSVLLKRTYPQYSGAVIMAVNNVRIALHKVIKDRLNKGIAPH